MSKHFAKPWRNILLQFWNLGSMATIETQTVYLGGLLLLGVISYSHFDTKAQ